MIIEKITPQIAALYLGQKCDIEWLNDNFTNNEKWGSQEIAPDVLDRLGYGKLSITPHLRRLETITEEEGTELHKLCVGGEIKPLYTDETCLDWWNTELMSLRSRMELFIGNPTAWLYLLSSGFDLFGLIDNGLAKEVTTQTNDNEDDKVS